MVVFHVNTIFDMSTRKFNTRDMPGNSSSSCGNTYLQITYYETEELKPAEPAEIGTTVFCCTLV